MKSILTILALSIAVTAAGQQTKKVTERWFPEPQGVVIDVPGLSKKSGVTSYKEMTQYIVNLAAEHPDMISLDVMGQTQKGREIYLVTVKKNDGNADKLRIFLTGRIHGDEPSGTEALLWLTHELAKNPDVGYLLDKIDFYIMPMINVDGAEAFERRTANKIDPNRDQSKLDTPEAVAYHKAANLVKQDIAVDFHEYQPVKSLYSHLYQSSLVGVPWDIMFLYSGNPNVPAAIRNTVDDLFIPALENVMTDNGLTWYTYFSPVDDPKGLTLNIGGSSPRSTSNAMALRNSISLLMETRGIGLGSTSMLRRVWSAYLGALTVAKTAYDNEDLVRNVISEAIADRSDIAVKFSPKKIDSMPIRFLDVVKGDTINIAMRASLGNDQTVTMTRPLPDFYYVLPSEQKALDVLTNMGIETAVLDEPTTVEAQYYTVTKSVTSNEDVGGVLPVGVTTKMDSKQVTFPVGTIIVPTDQRNVRSATVLLEPESSNGFVNFRVVDSAVGQELPIYRVNK